MAISEVRIDPVIWLSGLSSDSKPTTVAPFTRFIENDTGDVYLFTGSSWQRTEVGGALTVVDEAVTWSATTTADNAAATVTKAGEAGKRHYILGLSGSFSATAVGKLMTLKDGATVVGNFYVHNELGIEFSKPIKLALGAAAELSLAASGTPAQIGAVTLYGYTR